jgi:pimeloyl-ACP methyl ester carboxylesterase
LLHEQIDPSVRSPGFADAVRAIGGYDTRHRLTEIEIPTLVVWGMQDRIVPVEAAIGYHRLIAGSRLELFERTGHVPQMERPARFNALLDDFLTD